MSQTLSLERPQSRDGSQQSREGSGGDSNSQVDRLDLGGDASSEVEEPSD